MSSLVINDKIPSASTRRIVKSIAHLKQALQMAKEGKSIPTGVWNDPRWEPEKFMRWFHECLNEKINRYEHRIGRKLDPEYQVGLRCDADVINDHARRIVRSGRSILRTKEMKQKYPHIDNHKWDD